MEWLDEEEELAINLKASVDTASEEQTARVASFIYDKAQGSLPISIFLLIFLSLYRVWLS